MPENVLASKARRKSYSTDPGRQLEELAADEQVLRFASSRSRLASDPFRPLYHYVNPEGNMNDPNGLCFWQGRFHLFYQAYPPEDPRQHWGHAVSDDLVRWKDLPLAIYPVPENKCYSGSALVEDDRVIAMYHGKEAGNMVAVSSDPLLLNWEKIPGNPVIPLSQPDPAGRPYRVFDPCIWKGDDEYYSLSGSYCDGPLFGNCRPVQHLFSSRDLRHWEYRGPFTEGDIFTAAGEDTACPYFWPIGSRHILLFTSHQRGSQYFLGDYDEKLVKFHVLAHGRFTFGRQAGGGVNAPSATPDGHGGIYVIHNVMHGRPTQGWDQVMTLPRRLTLAGELSLNIEPVGAVESLRARRSRIAGMALPANMEIPLPGIEGNAMELVVQIDPKLAREICVNVLRSPHSEEQTSVTFYRHGGLPGNRDGQLGPRDALAMDLSRSSLLPDVEARVPEVAPFELREGEPLKLRIFVDRSIVEVFANGRQCLAVRAYPHRKDSIGVSLTARGGEATLRSLEAWQMKSIWES